MADFPPDPRRINYDNLYSSLPKEEPEYIPPPDPSLGGLMSLLKSLSEKTQVEGGGYYSGTKDYGNDWSGSRSGVGGQISTEIPLSEYLVSLMAKGYGFRNQETSPEGNKEIYSGGKPTGVSADITDRQDRTFGVGYDRNRLRKLMFRGKIPISFFSGQRRGVMPR